MLSNYPKTAFRSLMHYRGFSFINLLGLSVGMAVSFILLTYVYREFSYDRYHQKYDHLYQLWNHTQVEGSVLSGDRVPSPVAKKIFQTVPEITQVARAFPRAHWLTHGNKSFKKEGYYADPSFTEMFSFTFLQGNPGQALREPNSVVLTKSLALALFAGSDPINRLLTFEDGEVLKVTCVIEDIPATSSLQFEFLLPWSFWEKRHQWKSDEEWGYYSFMTFVELNPNARPERVAAKLEGLISRFSPDQTHVSLFMHPMRKWHLYSEFKEGQNVGGSIAYVRLFLGLALGILLIACINFMNLSTARSQRRAREVGVRKAIGAGRLSLIGQFLSESLLVTLLALGLALGIVHFSLPYFSQVTGTLLAIDYRSPYPWLLALGIALFTGLLAGSYPAFYLSSFAPIQVLKGKFRVGKPALRSRQVLVVVQFSFAIALIISTLFIYRQLRYIQNRPVGYQQAGLIQLPMEGKLASHFAQFRQELLERGAIVEGCATSSRITEADSETSIKWPGQRPAEELIAFDQMEATFSFVATFGLKVTQGRGFSPDLVTDTATVLLNETARRVMRLAHPIGQTIEWQGEKRQVVGVFQDFVWNSPFEPARPMVIACTKGATSHYTLRLNPSRPGTASLRQIEAMFKQFNPSLPFEYQFVEESFARKFSLEKRLGTLANVFAGLAIFISCLGLLGLSAFAAEQRRREMGIRKVLGATLPQLWMLLSFDFLRLVAVAFLVSTPVAYGLIRHWLDQYTYHIQPDWWVFALAGIATAAVALLTVSFQTFKAATTNPVQSLNTE